MLSRLIAVAGTLIAVCQGCGPSGCVDDLVCEEVLAKYGIVNEQSTTSQRFEVGDATYDFIQVNLGERLCCGGPDYFCEIWDVSTGEGLLFGASIRDPELQADESFDVGCPTTPACEWPGYSHPLVSHPDFIRFAREGIGGFMGLCRNWHFIAQTRGFVPSEP